MDSPSTPGELTVVSAGGRDGRVTVRPAPSGPVGCLVIAAALPSDLHVLESSTENLVSTP